MIVTNDSFNTKDIKSLSTSDIFPEHSVTYKSAMMSEEEVDSIDYNINISHINSYFDKNIEIKLREDLALSKYVKYIIKDIKHLFVKKEYNEYITKEYFLEAMIPGYSKELGYDLRPILENLDDVEIVIKVSTNKSSHANASFQGGTNVHTYYTLFRYGSTLSSGSFATSFLSFNIYLKRKKSSNIVELSRYILGEQANCCGIAVITGMSGLYLSAGSIYGSYKGLGYHLKRTLQYLRYENNGPSFSKIIMTDTPQDSTPNSVKDILPVRKDIHTNFKIWKKVDSIKNKRGSLISIYTKKL